MKRTVLYMASALAMMSQGLEPPAYKREKPKPSKCDQKKCKSCKFFNKNNSYTNCINSRGKSHARPMDCACEFYQKRKK